MDTNTASFTTIIADAVRRHGITPKQARFALEYCTNPRTVGNKTQSGMQAYDTKSPKAAIECADTALSKVGVQTYIEELLSGAGLSQQVRTGILADLARGQVVTTKRITQRDKHGDVISTQEIESDVAPSVRLKAVDMANKLDGSYAKVDSAVRLAEREYTEAQKRLLREAGLSHK